jgi:Fe-S cluster assembly protein SufD
VNAPVDAKETYLRALAAEAPSLPGNAGWLRELRTWARERFAERGFPTTREEAWRYTNLAPLARTPFPLAPADAGVASEQLQAATFEELHACRLVFVNGRFDRGLSALPGEGVALASLAEALAQGAEALEPHLGQVAPVEQSPLVALNTAFLLDGPYLRIPAGMALAYPIHVVYIATAEGLSQPRALIVAEAGSRATVIEQHLGAGEARHFTNAVTEIVLEQGAAIEHYRLQQEGARGYHINGLHVRQARDSRFTAHGLDLGGLLVRNDLRSVLAEGAHCELNGLYLAGGRQHVDNHTLIEHARPGAVSRELYKGVLDGRGRAVFNGRVVVHPDAQQSDAQQMNANLLLSEDAEVDTKPELEIYADDVKCSHGATVGQLDADQLHYLRTRALDEGTARDLLTFAFANEVLQRFALAPLRHGLDRRLTRRLLAGREIEEVELV